MGRVVNSNVRKWPLSSTVIHGLLKLPLSSLMEPFSCAKVRLWMTLEESKDTMILSFIFSTTQRLKVLRLNLTTISLLLQ